jgi:hypothetical protein
MKKISAGYGIQAIIVLIGSVVVSSCNSGDIRINPVVPVNTIAPGLPGSGTRAAAALSSSISSESNVVFFHRASVRKGQPFKIEGIGFLGDHATSQSAFGIRFTHATPFKHLPLIRLVDGAAIYLRSENPGYDELIKLDPRTLQSDPIARFAKGIVAFDITADQRQLVWVEDNGSVHFSDMGRQDQEAIDLGGDAGRSAEFADSSGMVFIHLSNRGITPGNDQYNSTMIARLGETSAGIRKLAGFPFARSPSGQEFAVGVSTGHGREIHILNEGGKLLNSINVESGEIFDLRWKNGRSLSYRLRFPDAHQELQLADVNTGKAQLIATLANAKPTFPDDSQLVCPVWHRDQLYFADSYQSSYAIYRARRGTSGWIVELFAHAISENEGYLCPVASNLEGSS